MGCLSFPESWKKLLLPALLWLIEGQGVALMPQGGPLSLQVPLHTPQPSSMTLSPSSEPQDREVWHWEAGKWRAVLMIAPAVLTTFGLQVSLLHFRQISPFFFFGEDSGLAFWSEEVTQVRQATAEATWWGSWSSKRVMKP